ncbi:hypothetical protein B0H13DRAFT_2340677 [Mycena leptocephala]|nr:hypothetical protein B0H13DRAFT_2340677 [Mycena leptocephala]
MPGATQLRTASAAHQLVPYDSESTRRGLSKIYVASGTSCLSSRHPAMYCPAPALTALALIMLHPENEISHPALALMDRGATIASAVGNTLLSLAHTPQQPASAPPLRNSGTGIGFETPVGDGWRSRPLALAQKDM